MNMFLYRNVDYFESTMNLKRAIDNIEVSNLEYGHALGQEGSKFYQV